GNRAGGLAAGELGAGPCEIVAREQPMGGLRLLVGRGDLALDLARLLVVGVSLAARLLELLLEPTRMLARLMSAARGADRQDRYHQEASGDDGERCGGPAPPAPVARRCVGDRGHDSLAAREEAADVVARGEVAGLVAGEPHARLAELIAVEHVRLAAAVRDPRGGAVLEHAAALLVLPARADPVTERRPVEESVVR